MGETHPNRVTFFSWPQRIMNSAAVLILGLLSVGATAETALEPVGLLALLTSFGLALRAARMGVRMDDTSCVVQNLVRTRRIGLREVDRFEFETNEAMLSRNESTILRTKSGQGIRISGLTLPVPTFLQGPGRDRCSALNAELQKRQG